MAGPSADPVLCRQYAAFAADIDRSNFRLLYWLLSIANVGTLSLAGYIFIRSLSMPVSQNSNRPPPSLRPYVLLVLVCVLTSAGFVVTELFILLALQFCDGEPLITLYYATWTNIQVGSLVAMMGIIVAITYTSFNRKTPPWGLALGTPVLVIAGILHLFLQSVTAAPPPKDPEPAPVPVKSKTISMAESVSTTGHMVGDVSLRDKKYGSLMEMEVLGTTPEGDPLVRLVKPHYI